MSNDEFQELKQFHMTKPKRFISSPFKSDRGRMGDLYSQVRDLNWRRECQRKTERYNEKMLGETDEP